MFSGGLVAFSKYESDDVVQSGAIDKLLRLAAAQPDVLVFLRSMVVQETLPCNDGKKEGARCLDGVACLPVARS